MGLKEWIERLTGSPQPKRGSRGPATRTRERADRTVQIPISGAAPAPVPPPAAAPAPVAPPPAAAPAAPPPAAVAPTAPGRAAAPAPPTPSPSAASNSAETEYHRIPGLGGGIRGVLVGLSGEEDGEVYTIRDGHNKLGRGETCDVVFRSQSLKFSREHAEIVHEGGLFVISTLAEQNPTFVNDEAIEGAELKDGDSIRLGRSTFRFRSIEGL